MTAAGPSATGAGHYVTGGELRTFAFSAVTDGLGQATGQVEIFNRSLDRRFHVAVNCLRIIGNVAYISGPITVTNDPANAPVGLNTILRVEDRGEGANNPPDRISNSVGNATRNCNTDPALLDASLPLNVVERGNVQVQP